MTDGKAFERDLEKAIRAAGHKASRPVQKRSVDVGDLWIGDDVVMQAKDWKNLATAVTAGVAGAQVQAVHARRPFGVAAIKRPRKPITEAIVAMPLSVFLDLLKSRTSPDQ